MIKVENITKSYGDKIAVNNLSLEVPKGEVVGLLGPNGAGKTTTLNIITTVLMPDRGSVWLDGRKVLPQDSEIRRLIGYLPEDNPLYPNLTVRESVAFSAQLKGLSRKNYPDQFERVVNVTGLKDILHQSVESLSKGLKQRVGLAQAMIADPQILILDEPTEGLDPNQRQEIRRMIKDLSKEHTILLSTHVMQEVEAVCEKVIILNKGNVVAQGRVDEIRNNQSHLTEVEFRIEGKEVEKFINEIRHLVESITLQEEFILASLLSDKENEFYQSLNNLTTRENYLSHLVKRKMSLEEVFSKLTQEK